MIWLQIKSQVRSQAQAVLAPWLQQSACCRQVQIQHPAQNAVRLDFWHALSYNQRTQQVETLMEATE